MTIIITILSISLVTNVILFWAFESASKSDYNNYLIAQEYKLQYEKEKKRGDMS